MLLGGLEHGKYTCTRVPSAIDKSQIVVYYFILFVQDGGLFTFGNGSRGQLGHDSTSNEPLPRRVLELMGTEVSQIACGR